MAIFFFQEKKTKNKLKNWIAGTVKPSGRLIIDDGSHHPVHQFQTFLELFQNLLLNFSFVLE